MRRNRDMVVNANNVFKSYGDLEILRGIDLTISPKQMVSIVGKSGSGKSTLLQVLSSLDTYDDGQVVLLGKNLKGLKDSDLTYLRNKQIGFIFQFHHLLPEFTALENVMLPLLISGTSRKEAKEKAEQMLEYVGLGHRQDHSPSKLSGGEQQRVAVARALVNDPQIVFADEPTGNLDEENSKAIFALFEKIKDDQKTAILLVTHDHSLAKLCDQMYELQSGKLHPNY